MPEISYLTKTLKYTIPVVIYICYKRYKNIKNIKNIKIPTLVKSIKSIKSIKYKYDKIKYDYDIIKLTNGYCHYRTNIINPFMLNKNNTPNEIYIFIHDNNGSLYDFSNIIQALYDDNDINIKKHYLTYDLYDRGFSHYDNSPQTLQLYILQLIELLYKLNITSNLHLIGIGMGSAIASGFASIHPAKIESLILLSPIGYKGYRQITTPLYANANMWNDIESVEYKKYNEFYDNIGDNIDSEISYINNFPIGEMEETYEQVNKLINNILIIWPEDDILNPVDNIKYITNTIINSEIQIQINYKHMFLIEHGIDVYNSINKWIFRKKYEEVLRKNQLRKETLELKIL